MVPSTPYTRHAIARRGLFSARLINLMLAGWGGKRGDTASRDGLCECATQSRQERGAAIVDLVLLLGGCSVLASRRGIRADSKESGMDRMDETANENRW